MNIHAENLSHIIDVLEENKEENYTVGNDEIGYYTVRNRKLQSISVLNNIICIPKIGTYSNLKLESPHNYLNIYVKKLSDNLVYSLNQTSFNIKIKLYLNMTYTNFTKDSRLIIDLLSDKIEVYLNNLLLTKENINYILSLNLDTIKMYFKNFKLDSSKLTKLNKLSMLGVNFSILKLKVRKDKDIELVGINNDYGKYLDKIDIPSCVKYVNCLIGNTHRLVLPFNLDTNMIRLHNINTIEIKGGFPNYILNGVFDSIIIGGKKYSPDNLYFPKDENAYKIKLSSMKKNNADRIVSYTIFDEIGNYKVINRDDFISAIVNKKVHLLNAELSINGKILYVEKQ